MPLALVPRSLHECYIGNMEWHGSADCSWERCSRGSGVQNLLGLSLKMLHRSPMAFNRLTVSRNRFSLWRDFSSGVKHVDGAVFLRQMTNLHSQDGVMSLFTC